MDKEAEAKLPIQIRSALRYVFKQDGTPAKETLQDATDDMGFPVEPEVNWSNLWKLLQSRFPDNSIVHFVPAIEAVVTATVQSIHTACNDDEEWADKLIGAVRELSVGPGQRYAERILKIFVEVDASVKTWVPDLRWESTAKRRGVVILLSPGVGTRLLEIMPGLLQRSTVNMFDSQGQDQSQMQQTVQPILSTTPASNVVSGSRSNALPVRTTTMPSLDALPEPGSLLAASPPYLCRVTNLGNAIRVECTHEPTLTLLARYLEKWTRENKFVTPKCPLVRIELLESVYGRSGTYEGLQIREWRERGGTMPCHISEMVPLAFLQGALGYQTQFVSGGQIILTKNDAFQ